MNIVVVVPDGVGIRNYLYSSLLKKLSEEGHDIVIWHSLSENALKEVEGLHHIRLHSEKLPYYKESGREKFLRESIAYARLKHNTKLTNNQTIITNWAPSIRNIKLKVFYTAVEWYGMLSSRYASILKMEERYQESVKRSQYLHRFSDFLKKHTPDVVFNTHQRAISAVPAIAAAHELGIKTLTAIYSWDNLPKARLATRTDVYLVWSAYMKNEMKMYYPEIADAQIAVTGTPQFEFYEDASLYETKETFYKRFELDPNKKTICFSGDDTRTSPYDPEYLSDLADAVMQIDKTQRPQILFRRCPADFSDRYDAVLTEYKEIIKVADPLWKRDAKGESWSLFYPAFDDVKLLVNVALHCDTVYNVGSTMAHDFAMFDKPAIYINYDQTHAKEWSVKTIYAFQHFKSMEGLDAVNWVNSKNEIQNLLNKVLHTPELCSPDRKKWLEVITGLKKDVSKNVVEILTKE